MLQSQLINSPAGQVLLFLQRRGPATIKELQEFLEVSANAVRQQIGVVQNIAHSVTGKGEAATYNGHGETFNLRLRIPAWSRDTRVTLNGAAVNDVTAGAYRQARREWQKDA